MGWIGTGVCGVQGVGRRNLYWRCTTRFLVNVPFLSWKLSSSFAKHSTLRSRGENSPIILIPNSKCQGPSASRGRASCGWNFPLVTSVLIRHSMTPSRREIGERRVCKYYTRARVSVACTGESAMSWLLQPAATYRSIILPQPPTTASRCCPRRISHCPLAIMTLQLGTLSPVLDTLKAWKLAWSKSELRNYLT